MNAGVVCVIALCLCSTGCKAPETEPLVIQLDPIEVKGEFDINVNVERDDVISSQLDLSEEPKP